MTDTSQGAGWWLASDGKWYPPELEPDWGSVRGASPEGSETVDEVADPADVLASWAPTVVGAATRSPAAILPSLGDFETDGTPPLSGISLALPGLPPGSRYHGAGGFATAGARRGRFSRALRLVGIGFTMVRDEPGLMMVPVVSFVAQVVIVGLAVLAIYPALHGLQQAGGVSAGTTTHLSFAQWLIVVVAGVLTMFVSVVAHATIIARVMARFNGRPATNAQAARAALSKSPQLLAWAIINYVVISVLRNIGSRGILGLLVGGLLRAGWTLASFFVVPVILFEGRGAVPSIKRSVFLCRERWGENIIGNSTLGIVAVVAVLVNAGIAAVLGMVFVPLGVAVGAIGLVAITLVLTVASAGFNAALYWYAVTDQAPGQYSAADLQAAYRARRQRTGMYGF